MRIGIITFHRAHNCGAMLQCVALQTVLERMGHSVRVIDCNTTGEEHRFKSVEYVSVKRYIRRFIEFCFSIPYFDLRIHRFNAFRRRHMKTCAVTAGTFTSDFDRYVVGSDQVFQPYLTTGRLPYFLLETVQDDFKKYTYAASFGYASMPMDFRPRFRAALGRFAGISVREESGRQIVRNELMLDKDVDVVLDPTLLLEAEDYLPFETPVKTPAEYVLIYSIGGAYKKLRDTAAQIARIHHLPVVMINACRRHYMDIPRSDLIDVSPDRFLYLVRHAKYIVTTSFHGVAFSLIFKKPFVAIAPKESKITGRISGLLKSLSLSQNYIADDAICTDEMMRDLLNINYTRVHASLEPLKNASYKGLATLTKISDEDVLTK